MKLTLCEKLQPDHCCRTTRCNICFNIPCFMALLVSSSRSRSAQRIPSHQSNIVQYGTTMRDQWLLAVTSIGILVLNMERQKHASRSNWLEPECCCNLAKKNLLNDVSRTYLVSSEVQTSESGCVKSHKYSRDPVHITEPVSNTMSHDMVI